VARYPKYTTTVVGSYSVPRWYEVIEEQVEAGSVPPDEMENAQFRATQGAILDQEVAGIDLITGGEMHRRTNNRHAPPNAMLNYFWQRLPGFSKETRPKRISVQHANVFHPAAVCTGPISYADLGLVDEFRTVSSFARAPVKITMTSPFMLAKVAYDEYYGDLGRMMQDIARVINRNFLALEEAGCEHVQLDEPLFAIAGDEELNAAVEAINMCTEGLTRAAVQVHVCQGNYVISPEVDGRIGHRYFEGRYPAAAIARIDCDALLIEGDMAQHYAGLLRNQQLAIGAVNVQDLDVETGETVAERISEHVWLPPEQTMITSSCGFNHLPRQIAFGKMKAMVEAKAILSGVPTAAV
jgi:5-methyltetrahydropteroyltriglutamate--homocysteine methyltransferase